MLCEETSTHYYSKQDNINKVLSSITHRRGICQRDIQGRSLLHMAILCQSQSTIHIYQYFLEEQIAQCACVNTDGNIVEHFKNLFKIYDYDGDTVLHKAVKYNLVEFVKVVLKFYEKFHLNVADYEKLGSGDNILHLAIRGNLLEMAKTIIEMKPSLLQVKNYGGKLPQDVTNKTLEMRMLLLDILERDKKLETYKMENN